MSTPLRPIIVSLGKQKRKAVKRLEHGEGPLVAEVEAVLANLRGAGTIAADSQPVVVVVQPKRRRRAQGWFGSR